MLLIELFDTTFNWKKLKDFTSTDGSIYKVFETIINNKSIRLYFIAKEDRQDSDAEMHYILSIEFSVDGKTNKTNSGDSIKIFSAISSKVIEVLDEFTKVKKLQEITFYARKSNDSRSMSRVKLYNRLASLLAKKYSLNIGTISSYSDVVFSLVAK